MKTEATPMGMATYLDDDFRVYYPATPAVHKDKLYLILVCEEMVGGRWEGFVSMKPVKPQPESVQPHAE